MSGPAESPDHGAGEGTADGRSEPAVARAAAFAAAGFGPVPSDAIQEDLVGAVVDDPDERARTAALAALVRVGSRARAEAAWQRSRDDRHAAVRRRAAELAPTLATRGDAANLVPSLLELLDDPDVTVVDAAAWALGELGTTAVAGDAVPALADVATGHPEVLAREAAVAALGALGDAGGLPAILAACHDRPTIRRRAVLALAPFEGEEVDAALAAARGDRDWQVRQAAEDLTAE